MRFGPVASILLGTLLIPLAPTAAATPDAIVLTLEQGDGPATLRWQVLPGPVEADAWVVTRIIDGVELPSIELPGTATSYEHQPVEDALAYVYSVRYVSDGQPSQQSNRLIFSDWPRCGVIVFIAELHPECAFPLPIG